MSSSNISNLFGNIEDLNQAKIISLLPNTVMLILVLVLAVVGNGLVLLVYGFRLHSNLKSDDRYFIPWLAIVDIVAGIIGTSFGIMLNLNPLNFRSDTVCKLVWTGNKFAVVSSGFMLLAISVQRYFKVCKPFNSCMNQRTQRTIVIVIFIGSFVVSLPCVFFYGEATVVAKYNMTGYNCGASLHTDRSLLFGYSVSLLIICFGGIVTMCILNGIILRTIYYQASFRKSTRSPHYKSSKSEMEKLSVDQVSDNRISKDKSNTSDSYTPNESDEKQTQDLVNIVPNKFTGAATISNAAKKASSFTLIFRQMLQKHRISVMFVLLAFIFVISFFPRIILMIVEATIFDFWYNMTDIEYVICLSLYRGYLLNNIINPLIYYVFDTTFRKACKDLFCRK